MRYTLFIYLFAFFSCFSGDYDDDLLAPIIVESAYQVPVNIDMSSSSVSVITKKEIESDTTGFAKEVLKSVPGVYISSNGGPGASSSLQIRGSASDQVLYRIDGINLSDPTAVGGTFEIGQLLLDDLEQIEIIKGPQSALWGSDAIGGVVNIRTKTGINAKKPFNGSINTGFGSNNTQKAVVGINGRKDDLYYALSLNRYKTDGISSRSRYTVDGQDVKATEDDAYDNTTSRFTVGYDYQKRAGLEFSYFKIKSTGDYDPFLPPDSDDGSNPYTYPSFDRDQEAFKISGHIEQFDGAIKHRLKYSQDETERTYNEAAFGNNYKGRNKEISYQLDSFFDQDGAVTQGVSAGLYYDKDEDLESGSQISDIITKSVALEYRLFTDQDHSLSIGARHDDNNEFDSGNTYRVAGGYRLNDYFRLHASYGTGIKNPTIAELSSNADAIEGGIDLSDLDQEKSRGGDLGITFESMDQRHHLDVTLFSQRYEDAITYLYDQGFNTYYNDDGISRSKGVELRYQLQFNSEIYFDLSYTYTDGEQADGRQLNRVPRSQAFSTLYYQPIDNLTTNIKINFVGSRPDYSADVRSPSYTTIDVGASYQVNNHLKVYGQINNLLDKDYENIYQYSQDGINFFLGLRGSF